jgi:signal transduction histidine kinase/ligand-binding sensor domain-containing protein/DNA-binding response OmpR family regulator
MCRSRNVFVLAWLGLLLTNMIAHAQDDINFTSITVKDGLSSNTVNAIVKDQYGLIWFGTTNGLVRYDGSNFHSYRHEAGNVFSLAGNEVQTVFQDRKGTIWTGTNVGGIYYYDRKYDRFVHYTGDGSWPEISKITVRSFLQDHLGNLWVGTYGDLRIIDLNTGKIKKLDIENPEKSGNNLVVLSIFEDHLQRVWIGTNMGLYLYQWKTGKLQHFEHDPTDPASLSNNTIKSITEDTNGNLWVGTYEGLDKFLPSGHFRVFRHSDQSTHPINNDAVWTIAPEKGGKLWIGTEGGINIYDPTSETFKEVGTDLRNNYRLRGKVVRSLLIDPNGIYWVGTYGGGVGKYDKHLALFNIKQSNPFDPVGLKSPIVTAFAPYKDDVIFVGTDGAGIQLFNPATGLFKPFTLKSKINPSKKGLIILSMYRDRGGRVWVGTYQDGLFQIDPKTGSYRQFEENGTPNGISVNKISSLAEDDKGNIWMGTIGKGVDIYNPVSDSFSHINRNIANGKSGMKLPSNDFITVIKRAPDGDIWIGSSGTGIAVYHTKTGTFTQYSRENSGLVDNVIQCMFFAKDQTLWIGTNQGVSYFDPKTQRFISYGEKDGLANGFVKTILEDNNGLLWFSTDKSISSFDRNKKIFRNFNCTNGVIQSAFMVGAGMKAANGVLYFGGQDGFNFFDPAKLPLPPHPGPVLLTDLKVGNMSVLPDEHAPLKEQIGIAKEIRVRYGQNFSLSYVSLDYTSATQSQYAYRLSGFEKEWNFVHQINTANYTNIDPGTYTFEVKATNNVNNWKTPVKAIKIVVLPPFWRTGYAYFTYLLLVGTLLWSIRRRGINKLKRQFESEREKLQIKQMIEQERKETERLHELDNLKIKFLTDLSHEFRTPISLIAAPVEKLLEKNMEEDDANHLKMISRNVRRLLNLVNQLLDFRKMEEHGTRLNQQPGNIINFITEAADSFRDIAERKQITLQIETKGGERRVLFDFDKLERIVFNLLSNAFKFTPKGGEVFLSMDIIPENLERAMLVLMVSDTGVGVPEKDLDKIFDRFFQTNQDKAFLNQGSGIGLAITREFVELHGGRVWAEAQPEKGTKFIVEIPLTIVAQAVYPEIDRKFAASNFELTENAKKNIPVAGNSTTVLLVEDNDEFREYLIEHLQQFYHIVGACDGKEGWQKTLSIHPQLVVTDISMPQMSGIELSKKIKADKRTSHIPIILLTAMTGEEDQLKGLRSGANDYLTKPFNFQILNARIENLLNLNKTLKDTYSKQIHLVGNQIETESAELKLINMVMKYVEEKLSDCDLSVEELSKFVGMSRASLYYKLIELTGLPPTEYIRTIKLDKAASLIETSDLNVSQIAYMTGFATPSYFSKMFKGKFGMSPSEYLNLKRCSLKPKNHLSDVLT